MAAESKCIIVLCMTVLTLMPYFCEKMKMLKLNARVSGVTETHKTRSLIECAHLFKTSPDSVSFNYKKYDKTCELSGNYFDESATESEGWKVYGLYEVVDGGWGGWMNWGSCSVTCGIGSRSRTRSCNNPSPSNGGMLCEGLSSENGECNEPDCFSGSTSVTTVSSDSDLSSLKSESTTETSSEGSTSVTPVSTDSDFSNMTAESTTEKSSEERSDCLDIMQNDGNRTDGVYEAMTWKTGQNIEVFCDMNTDGGGWTVFQYRFDGSIDFYRNFSEYENGFGNLNTEFWLDVCGKAAGFGEIHGWCILSSSNHGRNNNGLRYIEEIASQGNTDLRIDLEAADGTKGFQTFDKFSLSTGPAYTLHLGSSIANSSIASSDIFLPYHNGSNFTTYDHDVDSLDETNCAVQFHGAWWYNTCFVANLNGKYLTPDVLNIESMNYVGFKGHRSLKSSKMMMRRK